MLAAAAVGQRFGRTQDFLIAAALVHVAALAMALWRKGAPEPHSNAYFFFFRALWTFVVVLALHDLNAGLALGLLALVLSPVGRSPDH